MPQRTYRFPSLITRFVLLSLAAVALAVLRPSAKQKIRKTRERTAPRRRSGARRIAVSLSFATLFFAGAAFSAGAGDVVVNLVEQQVVATEQAAEAAPAEDTGCNAVRGNAGDGEDLA